LTIFFLAPPSGTYRPALVAATAFSGSAGCDCRGSSDAV